MLKELTQEEMEKLNGGESIWEILKRIFSGMATGIECRPPDPTSEPSPEPTSGPTGPSSGSSSSGPDYSNPSSPPYPV